MSPSGWKAPPGQEVPLDEPTRRRHILIEDAFIILSVLSLWPSILGWEGLAYDLLKYGALAGLVFIFIRRVGRYRDRRRT